MNEFQAQGPLRLPVMITAFKRYDTARMVMEAVRKARPPRFYFACDGPRDKAEKERTDRVRTLVELVDWPCEVHTLFHERNKGTKYGMVENMDWFFSKEGEGIVLEDDIVPDQSFFGSRRNFLSAIAMMNVSGRSSGTTWRPKEEWRTRRATGSWGMATGPTPVGPVGVGRGTASTWK
ncbi:MAG: hypothetical protein R2818_06725 [Flavobacteriales bacterium]